MPGGDGDGSARRASRGVDEIVAGLPARGGQQQTVTGLVEHDSVPWNALPGQMTELDDGEWRLTDRPERLPHTFTLQAVRGAG